MLVLTARTRWADKAAGFSAGADDYVTKPFETAELLFRLRALVHRSHGHAHPVLRIGELAFDTHTGSVTLAGLPVSLTAQESRLLAYLAHAAPRVVSRSELAEHVYERDHEPDCWTMPYAGQTVGFDSAGMKKAEAYGSAWTMTAPA